MPDATALTPAEYRTAMAQRWAALGFTPLPTWTDENGIALNDQGRYDAAFIDWPVLEELPTLEQGWTDDLKIRTDSQKVWLSRMGPGDGEHCDHHVTVERLSQRGGWIVDSEN